MLVECIVERSVVLIAQPFQAVYQQWCVHKANQGECCFEVMLQNVFALFYQMYPPFRQFLDVQEVT